MPVDPTILLLERKAEILASRQKVCRSCPLARTRSKVCVPAGALPASFLIAGLHPDQEADRAGVPFIGREGAHLRYIIVSGGMMPGECRVMYRVACRPSSRPDGPKVETGMERCLDWFDHGAKLSGAWLGLYAGLPRHVDIAGETRGPKGARWRDGVLWISTWGPGWLLEQGDWRRDQEAIDDVRWMVDVLEGREAIPGLEPGMVEWLSEHQRGALSERGECRVTIGGRAYALTTEAEDEHRLTIEDLVRWGSMEKIGRGLAGFAEVKRVLGVVKAR